MEWSLGGRKPTAASGNPAAEIRDLLLQRSWGQEALHRAALLGRQRVAATNAVSEQLQRSLEELEHAGSDAKLHELRSHTRSLLAMRGSLAAAGPSQQAALGQRQMQQQHASESALLRREHASESALLRRELGAADRALAQQRAIHRDHARYSALLRSELGAAEADLARAQQHAIDQDLEARVRHRVVLAELDLPSAAAARAPSPAPTPPGLAAAFGRLATAIEAVAPLVREQEYKELFDAALAVHVACRARTSPQRGDGSEVHI